MRSAFGQSGLGPPFVTSPRQALPVVANRLFGLYQPQRHRSDETLGPLCGSLSEAFVGVLAEESSSNGLQMGPPSPCTHVSPDLTST